MHGMYNHVCQDIDSKQIYTCVECSVFKSFSWQNPNLILIHPNFIPRQPLPSVHLLPTLWPGSSPLFHQPYPLPFLTSLLFTGHLPCLLVGPSLLASLPPSLHSLLPPSQPHVPFTAYCLLHSLLPATLKSYKPFHNLGVGVFAEHCPEDGGPG